MRGRMGSDGETVLEKGTGRRRGEGKERDRGASPRGARRRSATRVRPPLHSEQNNRPLFNRSINESRRTALNSPPSPSLSLSPYVGLCVWMLLLLLLCVCV